MVLYVCLHLLLWHWQSFSMLIQWLGFIHCQYRDIWYPRCACICVLVCILCLSCSTADAVSSGSWPILFKVLTLNVAICIVCLHFSSFCCLSPVADFSNTEVKAPISAGRAPFYNRVKNDVVYVCGLSVGHGYLSMAVFLFSINRSHSYRLVAVVPWSNWRSWALSRQTHTSRTRLGIVFGRQRVYSHTFTSTMLLPMCT